jgi:DNA-binding CsgD family transcriptional regulator
MWTTGVDDPRVGQAAGRLGEWVALPGVSFAIGELAAWLDRLGLDAGITEDVRAGAAEPFRHELEGRVEEAAVWWRREGAPFEAALALVGSADEATAASAVEDLESLGAVVTAARSRTELRRRGHTAIPPRRRASTRANPSGLTNRQLDVARLLARGLTNAELAEELFISPKTVDHHVSAVLARLGLSTRREVIRRAAELGLE